VKDAFSLTFTRTSKIEYTVLQAQNPRTSGTGHAAKTASFRRWWTSWPSDQRKSWTRFGTPGAMTARGIMTLAHARPQTW